MLSFARVMLPACVAVLCACTGTIGPAEGGAPAAAVGGQPGAVGAPDLTGHSITSPAARAACGDQAPDPGPSAIRRLTRREYNNGHFQTGRYLRFPGGDAYAHNRLLLSLMHYMGIDADSFGERDYCSGGALPLLVS